MSRSRGMLSGIDEAIARFERALEAVRNIPKDSHAVTINGIEHELIALVERLRLLRDEVDGGE